MDFKKGLFTFFLFIGALPGLQAQVRIYAGAQATNAKYTILNNKQETEQKYGFMAGIGLTNPVEGQLYFSPSLFYSRKGYKVTFTRPSNPPATGALNNDVTLNSISLAPLLQFNLSQTNNTFFVRFGPSIEVTISGKEIFDSTGGKRIERNLRFGPTAYSPATASANVHFGYQTSGGLHVYAQYEHGLSNLNNADGGPMILQRVIGLSVGWRFDKK